MKASRPDAYCRGLDRQPFSFAYAIALRPTSTAADIDVIPGSLAWAWPLVTWHLPVALSHTVSVTDLLFQNIEVRIIFFKGVAMDTEPYPVFAGLLIRKAVTWIFRIPNAKWL